MDLPTGDVDYTSDVKTNDDSKIIKISLIIFAGVGVLTVCSILGFQYYRLNIQAKSVEKVTTTAKTVSTLQNTTQKSIQDSTTGSSTTTNKTASSSATASNTPSNISSNTIATTLPGFKLYSNTSAGYGISIQYPSDWGYVEQDQGGSKNVTFGPGISPTNSFGSSDNPTIVPNITDLEGQNLTLQEYAQYTLDFAKSLTKSLSGEVITDTTVAGYPAKQLTYTIYGTATERAKVAMVMFLKNGKAYGATYTILQSKFDTYYPTFQQMLSTFKVL